MGLRRDWRKAVVRFFDLSGPDVPRAQVALINRPGLLGDPPVSFRMRNSVNLELGGHARTTRQTRHSPPSWCYDSPGRHGTPESEDGRKYGGENGLGVTVMDYQPGETSYRRQWRSTIVEHKKRPKTSLFGGSLPTLAPNTQARVIDRCAGPLLLRGNRTHARSKIPRSCFYAGRDPSRV